MTWRGPRTPTLNEHLDELEAEAHRIQAEADRDWLKQRQAAREVEEWVEVCVARSRWLAAHRHDLYSTGWSPLAVIIHCRNSRCGYERIEMVEP